MKLLGNKSVLFLLFSFSFILIVGCTKETSKKEEKTIDSAFISDVEKETDKRWDYADKVEEEVIKPKDDIEHFEKLVSFEKNLYKYLNKDFKDPKLKAIAENYINGVKSQEESIRYYNVDSEKNEEMWTKGYNDRSTALLSLVDEYGLKLNEEQFRDLKTNAQLVNEQNEIKKKIDEMVHNIKFNKVKSEYDWVTYNATVENTSGADLDSFDISINLIDKNGVVIGTESSYYENTWKPGQKVLFEFSTDITKFDKMEWEAEYYISDSE
ncbi:FxLYD domain-containing protein [Bacillus sp. JJ664]